MRLQARAQSRVDSGLLLLVKEFLVWVVVAVAVLAAWHYRLLQEVWRSDSPGLSLGVTLVFAGAAVRGSWHVLRLSRALKHMNDLERCVWRHGVLAFRRGTEFPDGPIAEHVRHLQQKAEIGGGHGRIDQALLLDALEADLRQGQDLGWFVANLLLSLGLLGTVTVFILTVGPISGLDATYASEIPGKLAAMSDRMAVVLYASLAGLGGGILLKLQCLLLDGAVQELVGRTTRLTEVFVLPALQRGQLPPEIEPLRHDAAAGRRRTEAPAADLVRSRGGLMHLDRDDLGQGSVRRRDGRTPPERAR